jgi:3-deoxy-manno-octulosonate cytidylyltransferase (CMP-KDO synthetase)
MEVLGVVPARYASSRLPGKPIVDICGKPMIWWVYQAAIKVKEFSKVIVATDDERIVDVCNQYGMEVVLTSPDGACLIDRLHELSERFDYDYYVSINGDEPLIESEIVHFVLPDYVEKDKPLVRGLMREFTDPVEVIDPANMKIVCNERGKLLFISRSPIPYPHKTGEFTYKKYVGVECYNKTALDIYNEKTPGPIEKIEDLGTLRFLENDVDVYYTLIQSHSLSVDTVRDLEKVRHIMKERLKK